MKSLERYARPYILFGVVIVTLLLLLGVVSSRTYAQSSDSITLSISPQLLDLTANPGERLTTTFRLTNASTETIVIQTTPKNFTPRGEEGAVDITEDRTDFSLADWTSVSPERVEISGESTQDFEVFIDVPDTAEPGSHFGSVVFATIPPESDSAAALVSQEIAPVILVKVAGEVIESAEIAEFMSDKSWWSNEDEVTFTTRLQNTGNVHFKPKGNIVIKNIFGSEVATIPLDERNVLPNSIRSLPSSWDTGGFTLGRYTAELVVVFGDNDEIRRQSTSFIVFPYQTVVPIFIALSAGIFIIYRSRQRLFRAAKVLFGKEAE